MNLWIRRSLNGEDQHEVVDSWNLLVMEIGNAKGAVRILVKYLLRCSAAASNTR